MTEKNEKQLESVERTSEAADTSNANTLKEKKGEKNKSQEQLYSMAGPRYVRWEIYL